MEVYEGVVPKNLWHALSDMYPATKRACDAIDGELWNRLVAEFLLLHPPRHGDPNQCGEPWADFIAQRGRNDSDQPCFLEEIADYERIRFRAFTSRVTGQEQTLFVRRYTHDVPAYAEATSDIDCHCGTGSWEIPARVPVVVVVYRSTETSKTRFLYPSTAQLIALACCLGEADESVQAAAGLTGKELQRAEYGLREMGLLPEMTKREQLP